MKPCPYGMQCYRKRPEHFSEFSHPAEHKIAAKFRVPASAPASDSNIATTTNFTKFGLYLTKVAGKPSSWPELSFGELLKAGFRDCMKLIVYESTEPVT